MSCLLVFYISLHLLQVAGLCELYLRHDVYSTPPWAKSPFKAGKWTVCNAAVACFIMSHCDVFMSCVGRHMQWGGDRALPLTPLCVLRASTSAQKLSGVPPCSLVLFCFTTPIQIYLIVLCYVCVRNVFWLPLWMIIFNVNNKQYV